MQVKTRTSVYELSKEGDQFRLVKISLKEGAVSRVNPGRAFTSKNIWINRAGGLDVDTMNTSPIENLEEVQQWLKDNGVPEQNITKEML
ncbi:hypothetical protein LCGC14_1463730 [marine sediment metagenome]|uniref:Uncharacterized protein n=1 Tax=marine sediment metagenome TaxID=412755 RepID=A0A0F9MG68_9ZZZZ